jgi:hypothetical protein
MLWKKMDQTQLLVTGCEKELDSRHILWLEVTGLCDCLRVGRKTKCALGLGWSWWMNGCTIYLHEEDKRRKSLGGKTPACSHYKCLMIVTSIWHVGLLLPTSLPMLMTVPPPELPPPTLHQELKSHPSLEDHFPSYLFPTSTVGEIFLLTPHWLVLKSLKVSVVSFLLDGTWPWRQRYLLLFLDSLPYRDLHVAGTLLNGTECYRGDDGIEAGSWTGCSLRLVSANFMIHFIAG